jgi:hypothetical protein
MKRLAGQAGRTIGWVIHHTGMILMTIFLLLALAVGGFAYRLSLGPLQIPWLASRLANIVSGQGINIHITQAALAWGGYKSGVSVPLFLQLRDISARNATGIEIAEIPRATLVFLPGALFGSQAPILVSSTDALFSGSSVPVSLNASFRLSAFFQFSAAQLFITLGSGTLGTGGFPIASGTAEVDITPTDIALTNGRIRLAHIGASAPVIGITGTGHEDGAWHGTLAITADSVQANDLAAYWPSSLVPQTRDWVLGNISTGTASFAKFSLGLSAPRSLATVSLDTASGAFLGNNLDVGWIPHAQPITAVSGTFTLTDKDNIDIAADTGNLAGIALSAAHMHISGLTAKDQIGTLTIPVTGRVQDALHLINTPPLTLLNDVPPQLLQATGTLTGTIGVTLPLKGDVKLQQVDLLVQAALHDVAAPVPVGNLAFSAGDLTLQATTQRLDLKGTAQLAGEPASITAAAQFEARGPDVSFAVQTIAGNGLLQQFGLNADPGENNGITGVVPISLAIHQSPAGQGTATLQADLTKAAVGAPAAGWAKPAGIPGHVNIAATITNGAISGITTLDATAPDLNITGASDKSDPHRLNLTRLHISGTEAAGSIISPAKSGAPWRVNLTGPSLNITAILNPPPKPKSTAKPAPPPPKPVKPGLPTGPLWSADLHFTKFVMAEHGAPALRNLAFTGTGQGYLVTTATGLATGDDGTPIHLTITHTPQAEALHLDTADGGYLLRALGAYGDLKGGALVLDAKYQPAGGTTGILTVQNFRLLQAPGFAKVLQGLTVYGIPEATSGPGLVFDHLVAPFAIENNVLTLTGARAFSASLGFTASGTVGLVDGTTNLDTTIIPAYALNAALGKIPLIGGLFSAEKGGGLFAVRAHITGQLTDPKISINPLSALTPGFLRDLFGVGENHATPAQ